MLKYRHMIDGITARILGDFGPFSRMGKSIGYQLDIGQSSYLLDCGAPLFQQIGGHGLKHIDGLIITHCHDDHKRWFSDLALFNMYAPDVSHKISLITSEDVHDDIVKATMPAIEKSLSKDSKNVIDIAYEDYIGYRMIGPKARYRIASIDEGAGKTGLHVMDRKGNYVGPDMAKIIISRKTNRPRLLFKDPDYNEWIEPESFYTYSSSAFYEEDKNIYLDRNGFTIEAIKAPVWHGVTGIGLKIRTAGETLIFSSDTAHDTGLWKQLCTEKKTQKPGMTKKKFESSAVIYGDINDYIERVWSEERYLDALNSFNEAVVVHDVSVNHSVVHTDYEKLKDTTLRKEMTILTHSPDRLTSEWVLSTAGKTFKIKGDRFYEVVGYDLFPMDADIYHREAGRYYVGYKNKKGKYRVFVKDGLLRISPEDEPGHGAVLYRIDLYEDISGRYFPKIENKDAVYFEREDGEVELVEFTEQGSRGTIVKNHRKRLRTL